MKVLALSDWRIQSLAMIEQIIQKEQPDLLLYAGDDLERVLGPKNHLYFKTLNNFIEVKLDSLEDSLSSNKFAEIIKSQQVVNTIEQLDSGFFDRIEIPYVYVNGNDDFIIQEKGEFYLKLFSHLWIKKEQYSIYENQNSQVDLIASDKLRKLNREDILEELDDLPSLDELKSSNYSFPFSHTFQDGVYIKISPINNFQSVKIKEESLSIHGNFCTPGRESQIKNPPDNYADLYLSHLPPVGILDLARRFGINHVGSKELLQAVEKHNPKFVISGHSHIWGGLAEKINNTIVLNVSSQDNTQYQNEGNYAIINTEDWSYNINRFHSREFGALQLNKIRGFSTIKLRLKEIDRFYLPTHLKRDKEKFLQFFALFEKIGIKIYSDSLYVQFSTPKEITTSMSKFLTEELLVDIPKYFEKKRLAEGLMKKLYEEMTFEEAYKLLEELEDLEIDTSRIKARIKSLKEQKSQVVKSITFNPKEFYFVDVETGNSRGFIPGKLWLIGIGNGMTKKISQFRYPKEADQFFNYLEENNIRTLVSWSTYDHKVLKPIFEKRKIPMEYLDACQRTANALTWYNYNVHEVYNELFPEKRTPSDIISGGIAGLYADHLILDSKKCPYCSEKKNSIIKQIMERNKLDIVQLIEICSMLYKEQIYECPYCDFKTKHRRSLYGHLKNKVCRKEKVISSDYVPKYTKAELDNLAHFNEERLFICDCGKQYLSASKRYILAHINSCSEFKYKEK
jgi:predicted phosphodiesterase